MKSLKYIGVIWSLLLLSIFAYGSDIEQAKQIFVEANEAYKAEDYSRALELYKSLEEEYSSAPSHLFSFCVPALFLFLVLVSSV